MNKGCWLLTKDGKKVAAIRQPDGTVVPLEEQPGPTSTVDLSPRPSAVEEDD